MIIAIDGPAASGKGTLGKRIAAHYGLAHLDTGKLYRAVARDTLALGAQPSDACAALEAAKALDPNTLDDPALIDGKLGKAASIVASQPEVRKALLDYQRAFAGRKPGAVLDGRDIGTVVCPEAKAKLFITATPEIRARRRHEELIGRGADSIYARVLEDMMERDQRDASRKVAPSRPAPDALVLDTSTLGANEVFEKALAFVKERCGL